jgi:hypothetical protein
MEAGWKAKTARRVDFVHIVRDDDYVLPPWNAACFIRIDVLLLLAIVMRI